MRTNSRALIGSVGFFAALTVLMTWPMLQHPTRWVLGPLGDNLYFVWLTDWYYRALFELRQSPVSVATLNAPAGWSLAYNEMTPAMALLGLPAVGLGMAAAYNLAVYLSFVLTGVFTFCWVRRLTGSVGGALVAGTCFAFAPYRLMHAHGHFNLLGTQWVLLYFWSLTSLVIDRGRSLRPAFGLAASIVLVAATSQYYLYMSALISVPIVAPLLWARPGWYRDRVLLARAGVASALGVPGVLAVIWPYLKLAREGVLPPRSIGEARMWFASPTDFFLPSAIHPWIGDWMASHFDQSRLVETTLQLSVVAIGLAAIACRRNRPEPVAPLVRALLWGTIVAFILSLGMELHWLGRLVEVPVPAMFQRGASQVPIPMPGRVLFEWLPYYANMRCWTRWGLFVALFVSLLAGVGFARVTRGWTPRRTAALTAVLLLLIVVEFRPRPYMVTDVQPRPVDTWLAQQATGVVAQIPAIQMATPEQTLYTRFHGHPFVGAFFSAFQSPQFQRLQPALAGFPDAPSLAMLRSLRVRWVVVDLATFLDRAGLRASCERLGLRAATELDGQAVFELE